MEYDSASWGGAGGADWLKQQGKPLSLSNYTGRDCDHKDDLFGTCYRRDQNVMQVIKSMLLVEGGLKLESKGRRTKKTPTQHGKSKPAFLIDLHRNNCPKTNTCCHVTSLITICITSNSRGCSLHSATKANIQNTVKNSFLEKKAFEMPQNQNTLYSDVEILYRDEHKRLIFLFQPGGGSRLR